MGLVPVAESEWLRPTFDRALRREAFPAHPESVQVIPGSEPAVAELTETLGAASLVDAAASVWEDLCLLERRGDAHVLTAAAVAFPTDWRLDEKMGKPLSAIHAPIHGYAEKLSAGVEHFFDRLAPGPIFGRANWFVVASDALRYLPEDDPAHRFAHVTAANAGETLFVRCERQTLRRLPKSGAVLFTIGIDVVPVGTLDAALVRDLAAAVTAVPEGEHERRAAPFYADALYGYAESRS
jgi:hypothetical protein